MIRSRTYARFIYGLRLAIYKWGNPFIASVGRMDTITLGRLLSVSNRGGQAFLPVALVSAFDYTYDALGRRTSRADSGTAFEIPFLGVYAPPERGKRVPSSGGGGSGREAFNLYAHNARSEVTAANRYWGDNPADTSTPVLGQQYSYAYDPIGNRTMSATGEIPFSGEGVPEGRGSGYTANELNQYTARTVPSTILIIGDAPLDVDVYVNGEEAYRQGTYWHSCITVNNIPSPVYAEIETLGIRTPPAPQDPPEYTITTNHVFVAQSPETFTYDLDGNMLSDGRFVYTWNGENRLICAETRVDLPPEVPRYRIEYAYDHQGRMVSKQTSCITNAVHCPLTTVHYTWDNRNIIAEQTIVNCTLSTVNSYYVWGVDLSGGLQGAGGVGDLLAVVTTNGIFAPTYDANGNVSEYIALLPTPHSLPTQDPCEGDVCEEVMVVYVYQYAKKKNPWKDPWIYDKGNDFHAIRRDIVEGDVQWSYVPIWLSKDDPEAKPQTTKKITNPDSYWTDREDPLPVPKERYCCRKGKKETK